MSTFEFLFSLFGLLLGFSIAEIAGGFSRAYDRRKVQPIGWLAPALAVLLIIDLLSFWYGAWFAREMELKFWLVLLAAMVGLLYYFAATQVFPREGSTLSNTDHVMAHRKPVVLAITAANLIMFGPPNVARFIDSGGASLFTIYSGTTVVYLVILALIGWLPSKLWTGLSILVAIALILIGPLAINY